MPEGQLYPDQTTTAKQEAIYKPLTIPGVNMNILTADITAREDFEAKGNDHQIKNCPKEVFQQYDFIHVPKPTTIKDAISFKRYFQQLMIYKSNNWATDDRIIPWLDQAIRDTRNARLQKVIDETIPSAMASEKPILWIFIYEIAAFQATQQTKNKLFPARVAECFQHEKSIEEA